MGLAPASKEAGAFFCRLFCSTCGAHCRLSVVAAPQSLAKEGRLVRPEELDEVVLLSHGDASHGTGMESMRAWIETHLPHASHICANNSDMLRRMALEGM